MSIHRAPRPRALPALLAVLFALALLAPRPAAAQIGGGDEPIPVPEKIHSNVPPIPQSETAPLLPYENLRSAFLQDWHPTERKILVTTRFAETSQLHEVAEPLGARRQLTFYGERVLGGSYRPQHGGEIGFAMDEGGAENYQLFLMDRKTSSVQRTSDGEHRYQAGDFSDDGKWIAYSVNSRNGRDFDVYVMNPDDPASERRVAEVSGAWYVTDWSADGKKLLALEYISANKTNLHVIDVESGTSRQVTPDDGLVSWGGGDFSADGKAVYTTTDRDGEFQRLVRLDIESGDVTPVTGDIDWDVESFDLSDDGEQVFFFVNQDGFSRAHVRSLTSGEELAAPDLPLGVAYGAQFRPHSHEVGFTLSWARSSFDVYSWDVDTAKLTRWTDSEMGGLNPDSFPLPELVHYPTFDEVAPGQKRTIPAYVYRPDASRFPPPWPVYVDIHGGPEGQERPTFKGTDSYLPSQLGVVLILPNVRGSAGYGKSYLQLDNGMKREDSVKDIGALLDWIAAEEDLDESRVMVGGGSYGGYMSLATMTFYNDRLCCGFDYVGISNFVTFLENTQGYRQDLRRVEYGDERDPEMRAFLEEISPLNRMDRVTKPMLVAQGANDPRVPVTESDQVVEALRDNGTPVWYIVAEDEGHGFAKKSNADYLRAAWIRFIKEHLLAPKVEGMAMEPENQGE
jgi:dipeptidyl aminopeptidase/acylaminoacyl peptidase